MWAKKERDAVVASLKRWPQYHCHFFAIDGEGKQVFPHYHELSQKELTKFGSPYDSFLAVRGIESCQKEAQDFAAHLGFKEFHEYMTALELNPKSLVPRAQAVPTSD